MTESSLVARLPCAHRCLHRDLKGRAKEQTLERYSKVYEVFSRYLVDAGDFRNCSAAVEMDRLVSNYKDTEQLSKTLHSRLLSAINDPDQLVFGFYFSCWQFHGAAQNI